MISESKPQKKVQKEAVSQSPIRTEVNSQIGKGAENKKTSIKTPRVLREILSESAVNSQAYHHITKEGEGSYQKSKRERGAYQKKIGIQSKTGTQTGVYSKYVTQYENGRLFHGSPGSNKGLISKSDIQSRSGNQMIQERKGFFRNAKEGEMNTQSGMETETGKEESFKQLSSLKKIIVTKSNLGTEEVLNEKKKALDQIYCVRRELPSQYELTLQDGYQFTNEEAQPLNKTVEVQRQILQSPLETEVGGEFKNGEGKVFHYGLVGTREYYHRHNYSKAKQMNAKFSHSNRLSASEEKTQELYPSKFCVSTAPNRMSLSQASSLRGGIVKFRRKRKNYSKLEITKMIFIQSWWRKILQKKMGLLNEERDLSKNGGIVSLSEDYFTFEMNKRYLMKNESTEINVEEKPIEKDPNGIIIRKVLPSLTSKSNRTNYDLYCTKFISSQVIFKSPAGKTRFKSQKKSSYLSIKNQIRDIWINESDITSPAFLNYQPSKQKPLSISKTISININPIPKPFENIGINTTNWQDKIAKDSEISLYLQRLYKLKNWNKTNLHERFSFELMNPFEAPTVPFILLQGIKRRLIQQQLNYIQKCNNIVLEGKTTPTWNERNYSERFHIDLSQSKLKPELIISQDPISMHYKPTSGYTDSSFTFILTRDQMKRREKLLKVQNDECQINYSPYYCKWNNSVKKQTPNEQSIFYKYSYKKPEWNKKNTTTSFDINQLGRERPKNQYGYITQFSLEKDPSIKYEQWKERTSKIKEDSFYIQKKYEKPEWNKTNIVQLSESFREKGKDDIKTRFADLFFSLTAKKSSDYEIIFSDKEKGELYKLTKSDIQYLWNKLNTIEKIHEDEEIELKTFEVIETDYIPKSAMRVKGAKKKDPNDEYEIIDNESIQLLYNQKKFKNDEHTIINNENIQLSFHNKKFNNDVCQIIDNEHVQLSCIKKKLGNYEYKIIDSESIQLSSKTKRFNKDVCPIIKNENIQLSYHNKTFNNDEHKIVDNERIQLSYQNKKFRNDENQVIDDARIQLLYQKQKNTNNEYKTIHNGNIQLSSKNKKFESNEHQIINIEKIQLIYRNKVFANDLCQITDTKSIQLSWSNKKIKNDDYKVVKNETIQLLYQKKKSNNDLYKIMANENIRLSFQNKTFNNDKHKIIENERIQLSSRNKTYEYDIVDNVCIQLLHKHKKFRDNIKIIYNENIQLSYQNKAFNNTELKIINKERIQLEYQNKKFNNDEHKIIENESIQLLYKNKEDLIRNKWNTENDKISECNLTLTNPHLCLYYITLWNKKNNVNQHIELFISRNYNCINWNKNNKVVEEENNICCYGEPNYDKWNQDNILSNNNIQLEFKPKPNYNKWNQDNHLQLEFEPKPYRWNKEKIITEKEVNDIFIQGISEWDDNEQEIDKEKNIIDIKGIPTSDRWNKENQPSLIEKFDVINYEQRKLTINVTKNKINIHRKSLNQFEVLSIQHTSFEETNTVREFKDQGRSFSQESLHSLKLNRLSPCKRWNKENKIEPLEGLELIPESQSKKISITIKKNINIHRQLKDISFKELEIEHKYFEKTQHLKRFNEEDIMECIDQEIEINPIQTIKKLKAKKRKHGYLIEDVNTLVIESSKTKSFEGKCSKTQADDFSIEPRIKPDYTKQQAYSFVVEPRIRADYAKQQANDFMIKSSIKPDYTKQQAYSFVVEPRIRADYAEQQANSFKIQSCIKINYIEQADSFIVKLEIKADYAEKRADNFMIEPRIKAEYIQQQINSIIVKPHIKADYIEFQTCNFIIEPRRIKPEYDKQQTYNFVIEPRIKDEYIKQQTESFIVSPCNKADYIEQTVYDCIITPRIKPDYTEKRADSFIVKPRIRGDYGKQQANDFMIERRIKLDYTNQQAYSFVVEPRIKPDYTKQQAYSFVVEPRIRAEYTKQQANDFIIKPRIRADYAKQKAYDFIIKPHIKPEYTKQQANDFIIKPRIKLEYTEQQADSFIIAYKPKKTIDPEIIKADDFIIQRKERSQGIGIKVLPGIKADFKAINENFIIPRSARFSSSNFKSGVPLNYVQQSLHNVQFEIISKPKRTKQRLNDNQDKHKWNEEPLVSNTIPFELLQEETEEIIQKKEVLRKKHFVPKMKIEHNDEVNVISQSKPKKNWNEEINKAKNNSLTIQRKYAKQKDKDWNNMITLKNNDSYMISSHPKKNWNELNKKENSETDLIVPGTPLYMIWNQNNNSFNDINKELFGIEKIQWNNYNERVNSTRLDIKGRNLKEKWNKLNSKIKENEVIDLLGESVLEKWNKKANLSSFSVQIPEPKEEKVKKPVTLKQGINSMKPRISAGIHKPIKIESSSFDIQSKRKEPLQVENQLKGTLKGKPILTKWNKNNRAHSVANDTLTYENKKFNIKAITPINTNNQTQLEYIGKEKNWKYLKSTSQEYLQYEFVKNTNMNIVPQRFYNKKKWNAKNKIEKINLNEYIHQIKEGQRPQWVLLELEKQNDSIDYNGRKPSYSGFKWKEESKCQWEQLALEKQNDSIDYSGYKPNYTKAELEKKQKNWNDSNQVENQEQLFPNLEKSRKPIKRVIESRSTQSHKIEKEIIRVAPKTVFAKKEQIEDEIRIDEDKNKSDLRETQIRIDINKKDQNESLEEEKDILEGIKTKKRNTKIKEEIMKHIKETKVKEENVSLGESDLLASKESVDKPKVRAKPKLNTQQKEDNLFAKTDNFKSRSYVIQSEEKPKEKLRNTVANINSNKHLYQNSQTHKIRKMLEQKNETEKITMRESLWN